MGEEEEEKVEDVGENWLLRARWRGERGFDTQDGHQVGETELSAAHTSHVLSDTGRVSHQGNWGDGKIQE